MNSEQLYFLQQNDLTFNMVIALNSLLEGNKLNYHTRSYKALHRRGLVDEDFQVTEDGSKFYQKYCSKGVSVREQTNERRQELGMPPAAQSLVFDSEAIVDPSHQQDLQMVIACWSDIPAEIRKSVVDEARRIAGR